MWIITNLNSILNFIVQNFYRSCYDIQIRQIIQRDAMILHRNFDIIVCLIENPKLSKNCTECTNSPYKLLSIGAIQKFSRSTPWYKIVRLSKVQFNPWANTIVSSNEFQRIKRQHVENIPWYRFYTEESIQYIFFYINNTSSILFRSFYDDFTKKDFYASLKKSLFSG